MRPHGTDPATQEEPSAAPAPTFARLVLIHGGELGKCYRLTEETTIGRDESNTVILDLTSVSRRHARLLERAGVWHVVDLDSTNGTCVNHREAQGETPLANGDLLKVGGAVLKFIEGGNIEALYHEEIHRLAILDGLTGVHNKRSFLEFLEREVSRSRRHRRPLSLALMDIDNFKRVNDVHGHLAGDHVLQGLAQLVARSVRREELFARYGGDEFASVLPEIDSQGAELFCQRIRRTVEEQVFEYDGEKIRVTVSFGVATMRPENDVEGFIKIADELLARAKQAGRNRVASDWRSE